MMDKMYNSMLISAVVTVVVILVRWKVWPLMREWLIEKKAYQLVLLMEESLGGGTGSIKFEKATEMLQAYLDQKGWKVDVQFVLDTVTAAVGKLHAAQGEKPPEKELETEE